MWIHHAARQCNTHVSKCLTPTRVSCDFDGTITSLDATDAMLETFATSEWRAWETRCVRDEITSQKCLARQIEHIHVDRDTLIEIVADLSKKGGA